LGEQDISLDDLEQYGRRKSIRFQNVAVVAGEDKNSNLLLASINKRLEPAGIELKPIDIIRFHRSSAAKDGKEIQGKVTHLLVTHFSF
jgi:hypothetical protein